uniref:SUMOconjugating enzyme (SCE) putative n=1 Tax=Albugo laibachii Nc14 TaxID=890382 RepID=F0WTX9_9STRA|nr:SUMOconjugating enzyme (SCE) putative [Albugo laibachii Nc14]|eukprot:CCA24823.1 SUMOconjugating enzyme (SCE) putative [Albugo laibachii Nc14]
MSDDTIAIQRLRQERKNWRRDHPAGFWARPVAKEDGSLNIMMWQAGIPGKAGTGETRRSLNKDWKPSVTIKQILKGIQDLLDAPNMNDPAQREPYLDLKNTPDVYKRKVRQIALKNRDT